MLKVSDAFNSAFAAPDRELRARVTIGKTVYDSDDLTSINYDSGAMTGEQFSIGSTYMNSTKITFSHLVEGLKQLDEVLLEFGIVKADGTTEYVKMGTFIIDDKIQMDRNNNSTTIECMDRMVMLGGAYKSKLSYPATIKSVAVEIANMAGVRVNDTSFARLPNQSINEPIGYSYRDAIGIIAQFAMGFALFDRDGYLDIRTLVDSEFKIDPSQYFLKGLVKNETFFKLNGISCTVVTTSKDENGNETSKTTVLQSGSSSGSQIKLANNVMTQDVLDRMYESLKFTNYYPFTLNWNGNPAVEAGDWLTLEDMQGNEFKVPNMSFTLTFNGGLTASSKAETSTNSSVTYSYGGSMSNIVNEIGGREGAEGNHIYEGTEDQEPALPKEGDLWYKHVGPDTEERIYKDGKWEFLTSTKPATDAQKAADAAQKEAEEAKTQANKAVDGANDAVAKAGFANDTAAQAKSDAAAATQNATTALTNAGTALTNAKNALDNVTKLDQTVKTEVTNINGQLAQKVSQTTFDTLKGTVTSQGTLINQNKDAIKLKADQTYVDTIKGTVANNTAAIDLNSKEIKLKASQSDVNKLSGRVTNTESQIKVQADQIAQTVSKTELTTKLNGYATQTWTQGKLDLTASGLTSQISSVKTDLTNRAIGGRNYFSLSGFAANKYASAGIDFYDLQLLPNTKYTVSTTNVGVPDQGYANVFVGNKGFTPDSSGNGVIVNKPRTVTTDSTGILTIATRIYSLADGKDKIQVELGAVATLWQPAPEDMATEVQFTSLEQTLNGFQTTVNNAATQTQVSQLAGQITSVVKDVSPIKNLFPDPTFDKGGWLPTAEGTGWTVKYDNTNLWILNSGGAVQRVYWPDLGHVGGSYSVKMLYNSAIGGPIRVGFSPVNDADMGTQYSFSAVDSGTHWVEFTVNCTVNTAFCIWLQNGQPFRLHELYIFNSATGVATSQITQLQDDVNLRVQKGDVINQINISPESILIAGQKVHITGQTSIDNAVIKDAMIANIKADKITAGTLNAANVNVINLNANNITTGTIKGANLSMNLNTGEVVFQHGRIHSASNNVDVNIDQGYLSVANADTRVLLKDGGIQFVQQTIFDHQTNPYLDISNSGGAQWLHGASIVGRDYLSLANSANNNNILTYPLGVETFAGISFGIVNGRGNPTKIGGAERGILLSAGAGMPSNDGDSPSIIVGANERRVAGGNRIAINGEYVHIESAYWKTASGSANLIVSSDGALVRSTSASKYKTDIIRTNVPEYGDKLLNLPTATWTDIAETKRYRDDPANQIKPTRNFGMIAEDLADAGLEMLVVRGIDGELEGINYDRIGPALIPVIAKLKNEVETLKRKLEENQHDKNTNI